MFTAGLGVIEMSLISAASMAVAIPTGIQVFGWIATLWSGRIRMNAPTLFVLGFMFIFVLGGLTGVMVAVIPFDWQVHDTYFIVAHLHYVLIGGMVFPVFAAIYYWIPLINGNTMSERLSKWIFWLMFGGFNISLLPDAHHGPVRHAAPRLHVFERDGLGCAEHDLDPGLVPVRPRHPLDDHRRHAHAAPPDQGRGQSVECGHARVAAVGRLRQPQHPDRHVGRPAVGPADAVAGSRRRPPLPARTPSPAAAKPSPPARSAQSRPT